MIFIIILQQFDGNILGPKILGNSTGLSSFWVVFAILIGGGMFGVPGMILGVPTFAVIYYIVRNIVNYFLRKRSLPDKTDEYIMLVDIDTKTNAMNYKEKEAKKEASEDEKVKAE